MLQKTGQARKGVDFMIFNWKNKTDDDITEFVSSMHGRLVSRRQLYEDLWGVITKIYRPRRYDILGDSKKGEQYGAEIFDPQPAGALNKFVGGLLGYMVNRQVPWIQFISQDRRLMSLDHIKEYCQNLAEQILYAAGRSNIYSALVPQALDAHSIGTSTDVPMYDYVKDRAYFDIVHPRDAYIATDMFGVPSIYHREIALTSLTAYEMFGEGALSPSDFKEGRDGKKSLKDPLSDKKYIWCVYPNNDRDTASFLPKDKPFIVFVITIGGRGRKKSRLVHTGGRVLFPGCWRSGRESGADYGTSIATDCLTASLCVNKLGEKALMAAHKAVDPAVIASGTLKKSLNLNPGGRSWVTDMQREGAKTIMDRLNWPITDAQMERLHNTLDDFFFVRFFEMLSSSDLKARTAYEISQMMGEKATLMSTITDTFEQESLEQKIEYLMMREEEAGRLPEPPGELLETGGKMDINYIGPLAQLQRSLLKGKSIVDSLSIIAEFMALDGSVAWKFNMLEMAEEAAVSMGLPQRHVLSDDEVERIREQFAADQQAREQLMMAGEAAKAIPNLGKPIAPGSPAALLMEGAA